MVKEHLDRERGNPLPPLILFDQQQGCFYMHHPTDRIATRELLFPISSKGYFIMHRPTDRIAHNTAFITPVVEHWLERKIA